MGFQKMSDKVFPGIGGGVRANLTAEGNQVAFVVEKAMKVEVEWEGKCVVALGTLEGTEVVRGRGIGKGG